jgi:Na+-driven multidrug efflux pump
MSGARILGVQNGSDNDGRRSASANLRFALPLVAGNLLQETYSVAGRSNRWQDARRGRACERRRDQQRPVLILGFCIGTCSGFAVPVARHFGAGDESRMRRCIWHGIVMTGALAVLLTVICLLLCPTILRMLSTPSDIFLPGLSLPVSYLLQASRSRCCTISSRAFCGRSETAGRRSCFWFFSTGLNIVLDLFCIAVLRLGVPGAAAATITAQGISAFLCLAVIRKRYGMLRVRRQDRKWSGSMAAGMAAMGLPMGLQYSVTAIGSMVMQASQQRSRNRIHLRLCGRITS